jgi:hypothetical protein
MSTFKCNRPPNAPELVQGILLMLRAMRIFLATVLICLGLMHAPARANLVQNGDFATGDLTGWSTSNVFISGNYGGHGYRNLRGAR